MANYLSKGWQVDEFEGSIKAKGGIFHVSFKPNHQGEFITFKEVWPFEPN